MQCNMSENVFRFLKLVWLEGRKVDVLVGGRVSGWRGEGEGDGEENEQKGRGGEGNDVNE